MHSGNRLAAFFRGTQDVIPENEVTTERLADVVCDTTEIQRELEPWAPVLALVAKDPADALSLRAFDKQFGLGTLIA